MAWGIRWSIISIEKFGALHGRKTKLEIKNRPLIRWAGSKTKILSILERHSPEQTARYIEPFCGSMSLFLRLLPSAAVVGDINEELINLYKQVQTHPEEVAEGVHKIPRNEDEYYRIREINTKTLNNLERAIRFFFLNRHCFNGVYRTNKSGAFNVPFGSKLTEVPSIAEILDFSRKIKNVDFVCGDFELVVSQAKENDFVYLDPPYAGTQSRDRGEYGPTSFKEIDISRLASALLNASNRGAKILLSYASTPIIKDQFINWNIHEISVDRSVSGFARGRKKVQEVLITNY